LRGKAVLAGNLLCFGNDFTAIVGFLQHRCEDWVQALSGDPMM
jgi:hypothetical protein